MMGRRLLSIVISAIGPFLLLGASASAFNTRITVNAAVPEIRAVYVNKDGFVYKVAGNTSNNVEPRVYDESNKILAMTESIKTQYDNFMEQHGWHLQASKEYSVNLLSVNTRAESAAIIVESSKLSLDLK
jgi:hypothetical protein